MSLDTTISGAAADSYATLAEYQAYAANFGWTLSGTDAGDEVNLRKGRVYLDQMYIWKGYKTTGTQALEWPRIVSGYVDGYSVPSDAIPQKIKDAQMEMAQLIQTGATPFASIEGGSISQKREKVDVLEESTTYAKPRERVAYPLVDGLVASYAERKAGLSGGSVPLMRG
jgi:hypothetical protein